MPLLVLVVSFCAATSLASNILVCPLNDYFYVVDRELRITGSFSQYYYDMLIENPRRILDFGANKVTISFREATVKETEQLISKFILSGIPVNLHHANNEILPARSILQGVSSISEVWADLFDQNQLQIWMNWYAHKINIIYAPFIRKLSMEALTLIMIRIGSIRDRQRIDSKTKIKIGQGNDDRFYTEPFFMKYVMEYVDEIDWLELRDRNIHLPMTKVLIEKASSVYFEVYADTPFSNLLFNSLNPFLLKWLTISGMKNSINFSHLKNLRNLVLRGDQSASILLNPHLRLPHRLDYLYVENLTDLKLVADIERVYSSEWDINDKPLNMVQGSRNLQLQRKTVYKRLREYSRESLRTPEKRKKV
jgi:hypothetical protein